MTLRRSRAATDRPTAPRVGRRVVRPYLFFLRGAGQAVGAGTPLVQSVDNAVRVLHVPSSSSQYADIFTKGYYFV
jgi:hypothetical protein